MEKGQRKCIVCGKACSSEHDKNWEEAETLGGGGSLMNPGHDAWSSACEERDIPENADICGECLLDLHGLAWSIRAHEEREGRRA